MKSKAGLFSLRNLFRWTSRCAALTGMLRVHALFADVSTVMFQDNMVLQQGMPVPVFGAAAPGEAVTVTFGDQTKSTRAGADGKWLVKLDPMTAGGPFDLTIRGSNTLSFNNVMVGEVWLCAGQSNMGYSMKKIGGRNVEEASHANNPNIRIVTMMRGQTPRWETLTPEVCLKSSATAYYFGKELSASLKEPIGLIVSSSPGTAIRYWVDPATIAADPALAKTKSVGKWYNELVKPAIPYAIRGAIWYQGESDVDGNAEQYKTRFLSVIKNYRAAWGQGDFPFLFVQLPKFGGAKETPPGAPSQWADLRQAQAAALALPKTAMAVTIDTGDPDWHPEDKWDVGKRLSLLALRRVYHRADIPEDTGPVLVSCEEKNDTLSLQFTHADGGLVNHGKEGLSAFAVCGAEHQWHWAKGTIQNDTVLVTCDEVKDPVKVRYAWADWPATPLYNTAGLPAAPFEAEVKK
ncbi:MAG: sialate O-acetylesterase [Phycisphaerae bacterium]